MRFFTCGILLLTAAVLANAGAIGRSEDEELEQPKVFKRSASAEGRTLSSLFGQKGGCNQNPVTETITVDEEPEHISGEIITVVDPDYSSSSSDGPYSSHRSFNDDDDEENADEAHDDADDDDNGNDFALQLNADNDDDDDLVAYNGRRGDINNRATRIQNREIQEYELRRQEETNKMLRQRIKQLQRRNKKNMRRAQRTRQQLLRRTMASRRRAMAKNRASRRRANTRNRIARRRLRRNNNNRRNNIF